MMDLLVFKEKLRKIYQRYQSYIEPAFKFISALIVFVLINKVVGFDPRLEKLPVILIMSLISAFTPFSILVLLSAIVTFVHVYYVSKILSILVLLILFVLYFLFIRFTPKQGIVVVAVPILFALKIPYIVPMLLGMVAAPISIVPTSCGILIYFLLNIIKEAAVINSNVSIEDTLQVYTYVINNLMGNKEMLLTIAAFAIVILVTYFVKRMRIDHAFDIAIVSGGVINMLIFLVGDLKLDISNKIFGMIIGTVISAWIVYVIHFFKITLDYTRVEKVQFEDDDYYYYVKAVPKINVTEPKKKVKKITRQKVTSNNINVKTMEDKFIEEYEIDEYDIEDDIDDFDDK